MDAATPPLVAKHINTAWEYLVEPGPAVPDPEQRRKSRLLAAVLLILLAVIPALAALWVSMHLVTIAELYATLMTWALLLVGYKLRRRVHYETICVLITICSTLVIFGLAAATNAGIDLLVLNYLIMPILFGGLFLSVRSVAVIFLAQLTGMWLLTYIVTGLTFHDALAGPLTFNLITGTIALLTIRYRNVLEDSRQSQLQHNEAELRKSEAAEREQRLLAEAVRDTAAAVASTRDLDIVMARILDNVGRVMPHDWAEISLVEGDNTRIAYCRGWSAEQETKLQSLRLPLTTANVQQMIAENAPLLIAKTDAYPGWVKITPEIQSFLGAPIRVHGILVGFLNLSSAQTGSFTFEHAERLRIFADETAVAIENAQFYNEVQRRADELEQRITERTAELYRAKRHTEAILNNSSDAILVVRGDGTISQVNPAFTALLGYHPEEIVGRAWHVFIKPEPVTEQTFNAIFAAFQPARIEVEVRRKDGPSFSAEAAIAVISRKAEGSTVPDQLVCSLRDISARKLAEEELRRAFEQEKELGELKDRFTAMVSHEFRTPLTVIRMASEMLANYPTQFSEERKIKFLKDIQVQVQYMVELMDDMLTIGKAHANKARCNPVPIDAKAYAETILHQLQPTDIGQHQFNLITRGDLTNIPLDENLLRQVLVNLLSNAIKYSPAGSEICFGVCREADNIIFQVRDQGIGIPIPDQAHIFEPFHRARNVAKIQGTGLGLSVVKANVEMHGGTIAFDSLENVGTTFTVRLPVTSQALTEEIAYAQENLDD